MSDIKIKWTKKPGHLYCDGKPVHCATWGKHSAEVWSAGRGSWNVRVEGPQVKFGGQTIRVDGIKGDAIYEAESALISYDEEEIK